MDLRSLSVIRASALPFRKGKPLATLYPKANPLAIDLMEQCLTFNPKRRIDVEQALAHPYLEVRTFVPRRNVIHSVCGSRTTTPRMNPRQPLCRLASSTLMTGSS